MVSSKAILYTFSRYSVNSRPTAGGTINRVLVLLRYVFNLARKWNIPGRKPEPYGRSHHGS